MRSVSHIPCVSAADSVCLMLQHFQAMTGQGDSYESAAMPEQESDRLTL